MEQEKRNGSAGGWIRRFFGGLTGLLLALILMGVIYLAAVLLHAPETDGQSAFIVEEEKAPVTPLTASSSSDPRALAQLLGAPLPQLADYTPAGAARNVAHDGQTVRQVTLDYGGLIITAVNPASAAPLLLREEMTVQSRSDLTVMNLPAVWACRGESHCLYFSSEFAAYSIYAPKATEEEFFAMLGRISQVR